MCKHARSTSYNTCVIAFFIQLDESFLQLSLLAHAPALTWLFLWLTQLGDARTIIVVALSITFVLWRHKRLSYKAGFFVTLFSSLAGSYILKALIERARPGLSWNLVIETGYSFPSTHAAVSFAVYGFLAYMALKLMHPISHRLPWTLFLSVLIVFIGFSRVYLCVHFVSDVLAGFVVGALALWLGVYVTNRVSKYLAR